MKRIGEVILSDGEVYYISKVVLSDSEVYYISEVVLWDSEVLPVGKADRIRWGRFAHPISTPSLRVAQLHFCFFIKTSLVFYKLHFPTVKTSP